MPIPRSLRAFVAVCFVAAISSVSVFAQAVPTDRQIVQVRYVQGDVRVVRAKSGDPDLSGTWRRAAAGLNLRSGDTLSTEAGRAEIELENGSVLYLADGSVVEFNALTGTANTEYSEITLLSGAMSAYFRGAPLETLVVRSPTGIASRFSSPTFVRFDSYLDGLEITALNPTGQEIPTGSGAPIQLKLGQTLAIFEDLSYRVSDFSNSTVPGDFNRWVLDQVAAWDVSMQTAFNVSHLKAYVPGLVDLFEAGKFFDCGQTTMCWEPNDASDPVDDGGSPDRPATNSNNSGTFSRIAFAPGGQSPAGEPQSAPPAKPRRRYIYYSIRPDCSQLQFVYELNQVTRQRYLVSVTTVNEPWTRATCHSGDFIYYHGHFAFVPGKKHRHRPFHWVKAGKNYGYVLRSPADAKGKLANLKYGVYTQNTKAEFHLASVSSGEKVEVLASIPKEFEPYATQKLTPSEQPQIEAHSLQLAELQRINGASQTAPPIRYDFKKSEFVAENSEPSTKDGSAIVIGRVNSRGVFSGERNALISAFDHKSGGTTFAQQTAASSGHVESTGTFPTGVRSPQTAAGGGFAGISRSVASNGGSYHGGSSSGESFHAGGPSGGGGGDHSGSGGAPHAGGGGGSAGPTHPGRG